MADDSLVAVITATIGDVDKMGLPAADRSIVLEALLRARLGGNTTPVSGIPAGGIGSKMPIQPAAEGDVLGKLGNVLQLSRDNLEMIYDVSGEEPTLVVSAKKLASNKSQAARQLGQLIAAARQIAGIEEWTSASVIRKVVQDYGKLDSSNFAASLQQMENVAVLRGKGTSREVKITKPGIEATTDLIKSLAGDA